MRPQMPPSYSLLKKNSQSAPMETPKSTRAASGSAHISSGPRVPDVAWGPELASIMAAPCKWSTFRGRMKKVLQRIWDGTNKYRKATRTAQMMEESDIPPPRYSEFAAEVDEEVSVQKSNKSTGPKSNRNAVWKPKKGAFWKRTDSNSQKPIESNAGKPESTPASQREIDYSAFSYPRLTELVRNKVDTVKLLRSVLVFVMFITFYADLDKIKTDTGSLFPWHSTIFTRTDADRSKFFAWDIFEITRDLSTLVRHLEQQVSGCRWFKARRQHIDLLTQLVVKPAEDLMIQADYALEILGTFRQDRPRGSRSTKYYSLVDCWEPQNPENLPRWSYRMLDLGDTLASHASLIASLNLEEKQQSELEDAMAEYLEKRKLNKVQMSETLKLKVLEELKYRPHGTCCWPMRDGYMDLFRMLGKTDGSCWRDDLKKERKRRSCQSTLPSSAIGGTG